MAKRAAGYYGNFGNGFFVLFSIVVEMIPKANIIGNLQHLGPFVLVPFLRAICDVDV